jgi:hypothetical protein
MAEVRGPLLIGWLLFLNERYGEETVATAMAGLEPEDRRALETRFLASSWYPYATMHSLRRLTRALAARRPADPDLAVQIGRAMARHAFTGVYKPLLRQDPAAQVQQFATTAEFFFRDTRTLESRMTSAASCLARYLYEKAATPGPGMCASMAGFWCQTLELAGARQVEFEHPRCQVRGDVGCEFTFRWRP